MAKATRVNLEGIGGQAPPAGSAAAAAAATTGKGTKRKGNFGAATGFGSKSSYFFFQEDCVRRIETDPDYNKAVRAEYGWVGEKKTNGGAKVEKDADGNDIPQPCAILPTIARNRHILGSTDQRRGPAAHDRVHSGFR